MRSVRRLARRRHAIFADKSDVTCREEYIKFSRHPTERITSETSAGASD